MPILKRIIRFLAKTAILKKTVLFALKELARQTDNTLDDQFVKIIEARLFSKK